MTNIVQLATRESPRPVPYQLGDLSQLPSGLVLLMDKRRFVTWRYVEGKPSKDGEINWAKKPFPDVGWNHPNNWTTHADAVQTNVRAFKGNGGIGFVLSPDCDVAAIDVDNCLQVVNGAWIVAEWAQPILDLAKQCNCYIEVTVSGRGLRFIGRTARTETLDHTIKGLGGDKKAGFEIYCRPTNRYITLSGQGGGDATVPIDSIIDEIVRRHPKPVKPTQGGAAKPAAGAEPDWRIDSTRGPTPIAQLDPDIMQAINGPVPSGSKSEVFDQVVNALFLANYTVDEIYQLMDVQAEGCCYRFHVIEKRLMREIERSFGKARGAWETQLADATEILDRSTITQPAQTSEAPPSDPANTANTANVPAPLPPERGSWRTKAMYTGKQLTSNIANARLAISTDFPGAFAHDEMGDETLITATRERLTDSHVIELQTYLQTMGLQRIGKEAVYDAISIEARRNSFHPIRDYLNGLEWDTEERLPTWLSTYLGAPQNKYTGAVGKMFLISAVARIEQPGCQADYVLVFEGPQGELKSSVCRILASNAHFLDHLPPLSNKDSSQILRGKWFVECAEMRAFSDAKIAVTKEFITRRAEIYFARYGRVESKEPRQCVVIISTNDSIYLYDTTGNRRYWPVVIGTINLTALKNDRDQLWAEAKARYDKGEHWWPDRAFERQYIQPEQELREAPGDPWVEPITKYLDTPVLADPTKPRGATLLQSTTTIGAIGSALGIETKNMERKDSLRIANILATELKWTRGPKVKGQQVWLRPAPPGGNRL